MNAIGTELLPDLKPPMAFDIKDAHRVRESASEWNDVERTEKRLWESEEFA
jgi:hypothetical protein